MYKLYWIKTKDFVDPKTEGYIGITSQTIEKRFSNHKHNSKNNHLKNRCRQPDTQIVCLFENLSKDEAKKLEEQLRPDKNIGWNINKGGDLPPSKLGIVNPSCLLVGKDRTEKQKEASKKHSERMKGNNSSGKRKNRVDPNKKCVCCGNIFNSNHNLKRKYCSLSCSTKDRSNNEEFKTKVKNNMIRIWRERSLQNE
jgi:predicted GIY-YIG superfamily endonuclease